MSRFRAGVAVLLVALALSACAGIPSSGPVTKVEDDAGLGESTVRYSPAKPTDGASPEQIVRGYLDAMLAFPASSRTAEAFLTSQAAKDWNPTSGVGIYSRPEVAGREASTSGLDEPDEQGRNAVDVRVGFTAEARLDRQGHYERLSRPDAQTYTLVRVGGEWRITNPQDGQLVNLKFFTDYFRPFNLFFFDRPGLRLVADPVHLVVGDQLASALVTNLARGPSAAIRQAGRTYLPPLRSLRPSVPVSSDGVADVEFTDTPPGLGEAARARLSAQVVWTLRQVPGVGGVEIVGGSAPLLADGPEVQSITAWGSYGPSRARGRAYAIQDDTVIQVVEGEVSPMSGGWGRDARGAVAVAVADAGVAGVLAGRDEVRLTSRSGRSPQRIRGNGLITPQWDGDGVLWLLDRRGAGTRVRVVEGAEVRSVGAARLRGLTVETFDLSPDDSRYVATVAGDDGRRMLVGSVLRDAKDRVLGLGPPREVPVVAPDPHEATWWSTTELGFLADSGSGLQVHRVAIDGAGASDDLGSEGDLLPDVGTDALAIGPVAGAPLYTTDGRDRLWFRPDGDGWRLIDGSGVTGLTYGR